MLIVLGTSNRGKTVELQKLLAPLDIELQTLADFPDAIDVVEDGDSFAANAALKSQQQAMHLRQWVLAEDSGLMVDALDGAPGIYSARYSGDEATDTSNNRLLLEELLTTPAAQRTARYVCHMTLSDPTGKIRAETEAHCCGRILSEPRGTNGFGYDPLFEVVEYHRCFGELGPLAKATLSHRARATMEMVPRFVAIADAGWVVE